jgi:hypothetical protein
LLQEGLSQDYRTSPCRTAWNSKTIDPMRYALLYYGAEDTVAEPKRRDDSIADIGSIGPERPESRTWLDIQLLPTTTAIVVRGGPTSTIIDGPLIARRQDLLSLRVIEAANLDKAMAFVEASLQGAVGLSACEIRPLASFQGSDEGADLPDKIGLPKGASIEVQMLLGDRRAEILPD